MRLGCQILCQNLKIGLSKILLRQANTKSAKTYIKISLKQNLGNKNLPKGNTFMKKIFFILTSIVLCGLLMSACEENTKIYNTWNLITLSVDDNPIDPTNSEKQVFITVEDQKFNGYAGCNLFFGNLKIQKNKIQTSSIGSTKMLCEPSAMEIEVTLLRLFSDSVIDFVIKDKNLVLEKDGIKAIFEAKGQ